MPLEVEEHEGTLPHWGATLGDIHFAIHPIEDFADGKSGVGAVKLAFTVFDLAAAESLRHVMFARPLRGAGANPARGALPPGAAKIARSGAPVHFCPPDSPFQGNFMSLSRVSFRLVAIISIALCGAVDVAAQGSRRDLSEQPENQVVDPKLLEGLEFRSVGFSRGGRSTAVAGVAGQPLVYYFGATGGGVWKTVDAGHNWKNVTDGTLGVGSVGAIEVAPSDPNVVYVGTGSACPRGNTSVGDGMYRSLDAGKSWEHVGLRQAGQIGEIQVHPQNPDLVYVAALGHIFGPNEERGIYRSDDGGKTWERVFFIGSS